MTKANAYRPVANVECVPSELKIEANKSCLISKNDLHYSSPTSYGSKFNLYIIFWMNCLVLSTITIMRYTYILVYSVFKYIILVLYSRNIILIMKYCKTNFFLTKSIF